MRIGGHLAADAPDPRNARLALIADLGVPVAGLVPQRHLEERGEAGVASSRRGGAESLDEAIVSRTYLLWRNPDDHDDSVNLAELSTELRATLDAPLERPLPGWLLEARRMLRYPRLWEAVRTHWTAPGQDAASAADRLVAHAELGLANRFREQLGLGDDLMAFVPPIALAALQPAPVVVDGVARDGLLLDTDPFVLGLGCRLDDGRVVTVVVPREDLPLLVLDLVSDAPIR